MKQRGVASVELALLLPILVLLLGALYDFGCALHDFNLMSKQARAAARHLMSGKAEDTQRQQEAKNLVVFGNTQGSGTPLLATLNTGMVQILQPQADTSVQLVSTGKGPLSLVSVTITGYRYSSFLLGALMPDQAVLGFSDISATLPYNFF